VNTLGWRQIWTSAAPYSEPQARVEEEKKRPGTAQKPKGTGGGGCTVVTTPSPTGGVTFSCSGGCGIFDRFLGRSCTKISQSNPGDDGWQVFCTCTGGWFDRIFG
jgi:hypothetical protein